MILSNGRDQQVGVPGGDFSRRHDDVMDVYGDDQSEFDSIIRLHEDEFVVTHWADVVRSDGLILGEYLAACAGLFGPWPDGPRSKGG